MRPHSLLVFIFDDLGSGCPALRAQGRACSTRGCLVTKCVFCDVHVSCALSHRLVGGKIGATRNIKALVLPLVCSVGNDSDRADLRFDRLLHPVHIMVRFLEPVRTARLPRSRTISRILIAGVHADVLAHDRQKTSAIHKKRPHEVRPSLKS